MTFTYDFARTLAQAQVENLTKGRNYLEEPEVEQVILLAEAGANASAQMAKMPPLSDVEKQELRREISRWKTVFVPESTQLTGDEASRRKAWLDDDGIPLNSKDFAYTYYDRYDYYLRNVRKWPVMAVNSVQEESLKVLRHLGDPRDKSPWARRGMVVGYVQSGKTANFTAVINRAIDVGYKVVIVLTGIMEDLRQQTQGRLDHEVTGFDTTVRHGEMTRVGVGLVPSPRPPVGVHNITHASDNGDFRKHVEGFAPQDIQNGLTFMLVVKKNASVLKRLNEWLEGQAKNLGRKDAKIGLPCLLIDDECDQASLNTQKNEDPSSEQNLTEINRQIRRVLSRFECTSYIGYTATPFANIFIHPESTSEAAGDNLFPKDFIVMLEASPEYIGANSFFGFSQDPERGIDGQVGLPLVRDAMDALIQFPQPHRPVLAGQLKDLPESLLDAVASYMLSIGVRANRGDSGEHSSMLVHVSRFVDVQDKVFELLKDHVEKVQNAIRYEEPNGDSEIWARLRRVFQDDLLNKETMELADKSAYYPKDISELKSAMSTYCPRVVVKCINGKTNESLKYPKGTTTHVIAVGGDRLSRGLTLEGLVVSYFIRQSKMYDSLMQMGRWFGYRPGYRDLCRIWTTPSVYHHYRHIALAVEELRRDFHRMAKQNRTPADFGLRVRSDPTMGLIITSRNKLQTAVKYKISLSGRLLQTLYMDQVPAVHEGNHQVVDKFLTAIAANQGRASNDTHLIFERVAAAHVLEFLDEFAASYENAVEVNTDIIRKYIDVKQKEGELVEWTIVVPCNGDADVARKVAGHEVKPVLRRATFVKDTRPYFHLGVLTSPSFEMLDLSAEEKRRAQDATREELERQEPNGKAPKRSKTPDSQEIRRARSARKGLLALYPIDAGKSIMRESTQDEVGSKGWRGLTGLKVPVWGYSFSLPYSQQGIGQVEYLANVTYQKQFEKDKREQDEETGDPDA